MLDWLEELVEVWNSQNEDSLRPVYADVLKNYDFVKVFQDKLDWDWITCEEVLDEEFIREFQDKVYWNNISYYQNISTKFANEFKDKINWKLFDRNKKQRVKESLIEMIED